MNRDLRHNRGQAAVEMALALPIVLLLMLGIMEGGWLMFVYGDITAAGREGARYGASVGSVGSTPLYNDCAGIKAAVMRIGVYAGITVDQIQVFHLIEASAVTEEYCTVAQPLPPTPYVQDDRIIVNIDTVYHPITPTGIIPSIGLHSRNAHSIVLGAEVVAKPNTFPGTGAQCDLSKYTVSQTVSGKVATITVKNTSGPAANIVYIRALWESTNKPLLQTILPVSPTTFTSNPVGLPTTDNKSHYYESPIGISFPAGATVTLTMTYSQTFVSLKPFVALTLDSPAKCSLEIHN